MNIYDILAKEPKFAGTQRENLPAQVSLEWKFNESSKLVAIMVMAVDMILEKIDTMPIDSRESIQSSMRFIPLFFALEDHSAWLRLMGASLNSMKHYDTSDINIIRAFEALVSIRRTIASVFDGKVTTGMVYQVQNNVSISVLTNDDLNALAYYLIYHTQSGKGALMSLEEFVAPQ